METSAVKPTMSGLAFRVSILGSQPAEAYPKVHVEIDADHGFVHIFSADRQIHYLTIPASCALIEWRDTEVLGPQVRMPSFGSNAFAQAGEQMQRMIEGLGKGFPGPR